MEYEVEVIIKRYVENPYHPFEQPMELEVYKESRTINLEDMREANGATYDVMDDFKYLAAEAVMQDYIEEESVLYESLFDDKTHREDQVDNEAKARLRGEA